MISSVRQKSPHGPADLRSFSLVEMLVAIAILSILVVILCSMLGSLTAAWQLGQAHNERRNTASAVMDRLSRDLRQAALPSNRTSTNGIQFIINPPGVGATYENPQAFFWQAPVATDGSTNGNLAVVGYFVQWVNGSPGTPCLCRILINPSSPDYDVYTTPNAWITSSLIGTYASATPANNYAGLLSENVLGLWVQALSPQGYPTQQTPNPGLNGEAFDSRYSYISTNYSYPTAQVMTNVPSVLPSSVQVAIAVIDSRTAARLSTTGKPNYPALTGNFWADVQSFYNGLPNTIRQGTEIETMTIPLANGPR